MTLAIALIAGASAASAAPEAQHSKAENAQPSCLQKAETQYELDACAGSMAKAADARLNKSYRELMCYLNMDDYKDERAQLVAAQRAWLAFRDADCAWQGSGGGSISPMNQALCLAGLSDARAKELDSWPFNADRSSAMGPCPPKQ
jgi:uncharacterized protein YecT (DUF1311 family)